MNPTQESGNAGGVKSGYSFKRPYIYRPESIDHVRRVEYDSGVLQTNRELDEFIRTCQEIGIYDSLAIAYDASFGIKTRISGSNTFVSKAYNLPNANDATQTTSTSQPHLGNTIAPNERPSFKNQNGQSNFLTHPTISFAANQEWTVHTVVGWNGSSELFNCICANGASNIVTKIYIKSSDSYLSFINESNVTVVFHGYANRFFIGKNKIISLVANGSSLALYIDGTFIEQKSIATNALFNTLMHAAFNDRTFKGSIPLHTIFSKAHTPTQIAQFANYLKVKYPEIPTVRIGAIDISTSNCEQVTSSNGTAIADGNVQDTWASDAAAYWCFHTDSATGVIYGKLYNKKAKLVLVANPPEGYHVTTKAEWLAIAANGGNALKKDGSLYWATTGGTNTTGFSAIGGASRNADGTFNALKNTASFWCADTDEVLLLNHNDNTATIVAATSAQGHSIRFTKN